MVPPTIFLQKYLDQWFKVFSGQARCDNATGHRYLVWSTVNIERFQKWAGALKLEYTECRMVVKYFKQLQHVAVVTKTTIRHMKH